MNEALLDYLASFGFKKLGKEAETLVGQMSKQELLVFSEGAEQATEYATRRAQSPFEFSASHTFAGAPTPCSGFGCRMDRVQELGYFAALYADRVLISSPFHGINSSKNIQTIRNEVMVAVASCMYLKPLLNAGLVQYTHRHYNNVCVECYGKLSGKPVDEWSNFLAALCREYQERAKYYLEKEDGQVFVVPDGPPDLFDAHTSRELKSIPESMKRVVARGNGRWLIPAPVAEELKIPRDYAAPVAIDVLSRDMCASKFGTGYLTRREIDLRLTSVNIENGSNTFLDRNLGHEIAMLNGVSPSDLLKLRDDELDAFRTYQMALRRAATQSAGASNRASLSELFRDVVEPEIRRMNAALKSARNSLLRGLGADVASATAFVSLALFSGLVTPGLATAITALGGIHFTDKVAEKLSKLIKQEPPEARNNPFYFLWKASRGR